MRHVDVSCETKHPSLEKSHGFFMPQSSVLGSDLDPYTCSWAASPHAGASARGRALQSSTHKPLCSLLFFCLRSNSALGWDVIAAIEGMTPKSPFPFREFCR